MQNYALMKDECQRRNTFPYYLGEEGKKKHYKENRFPFVPLPKLCRTVFCSSTKAPLLARNCQWYLIKGCLQNIFKFSLIFESFLLNAFDYNLKKEMPEDAISVKALYKCVTRVEKVE